MMGRRGEWFAMSLALGVSADALLRLHPWGLNAFLWSAGVIAAGGLVRRRGAAAGAEPSPWLLGAAVVLAGLVTWRASAELAVINLVGVVLLLAMAVRRARCAALAPEGRSVGVLPAVADAAASFGVALKTLVAFRSPVEERIGAAGRWRPILVGTLLALPILLVFGSLFATADPVFDRLVRQSLSVRYDRLAEHGWWIAWGGWAAAAYLVGVVRGPALPRRAMPLVPLGITEITVVLGAVAALFAVFVATQAGVLFGGEALVRRTSGLTLAEYARGGFYQLTAAAALSLPLVVLAGHVLRVSHPNERLRYRWLGLVQLGLLLPVIASAMWRMSLYIGAYGLSTDRLYASAFMLWLAGTVVLVARSLRTGHGREVLTAGGLGSAFLGIVLLNLMNPAAVVARWNLARAGAGVPVDIEYLAGLGADAVPALVNGSSRLSAEERCVLLSLLRAGRPYWDGRWRTLNLGRMRADRVLGRLDPPRSGICLATETISGLGRANEGMEVACGLESPCRSQQE